MNKVGSGGTGKIGRNRDKCAKYAGAHMRERNKIKKWKKLIKGLLSNNNTRIELEKRIKEIEMKIIV